MPAHSRTVRRSTTGGRSPYQRPYRYRRLRVPPEPVSQSPTSTPQKGESDAPSVPHLDNQKLEQLVGRFVQDLGAVLHAATLLVGDRLGLLQAMADSAWITGGPAERTVRTSGTWPNGWRPRLPLVTPNTTPTPAGSAVRGAGFRSDRRIQPIVLPGRLEAAAAIKDVELITDAFRDGHGVAWGEHHPDLFVGTDRFFRPNYIANLTPRGFPRLTA